MPRPLANFWTNPSCWGAGRVVVGSVYEEGGTMSGRAFGEGRISRYWPMGRFPRKRRLQFSTLIRFHAMAGQERNLQVAFPVGVV